MGHVTAGAPVTIFTEVITGDAVGFEVYGGLAACLHYLLGSSTEGAAAFRNLPTDDQKRRLIDATRYIDEQFWQGTATGLVGVDVTTLAFPRSGLTDLNGAPLSSTVMPIQVPCAAFEMSAILSVDPSAAANVDTGSNVESLGAGPARISFFRSQSVADGNATVMPTVVDRLIGRWCAAASAGSAFAGVATGTNPCSDFDTRDRRDRFIPL